MQSHSEKSPLIYSDSDVSTEAKKDQSQASHMTTPQIRNRRSLLLYSLAMVLAGLAGHTLTAAHYHNKLNTRNKDDIDPVQLPMFSKSHHKDKDQRVAEEAFQNNLAKPSLEAEMYYDGTTEEKDNPVLGSSSSHQTLSSPPQAPPPGGCQATVILMRHCEKGSIREHCNYLGFERANYISTLFGDDPDARWPAPSYLFALAPGERSNKDVKNWREVETIQPLSNKIGVAIDDSFGMETKNEFAKHIFHLLRSGEMCGKVALVSWKHEDMPHLARSLGCGPNDGCPNHWADDDDYDSTWQIFYSYHKQLYPSFAIEDKKNKHKMWGKHPQWWISGHVESEGFDPLKFSKNHGAYGSIRGSNADEGAGQGTSSPSSQ